MPIDARGEFAGTFFGLLHPYALWMGLTTVALFAMHGGIYLVLKTDGELQTRVRQFVLEAYTPAQLAFGTGGPKDVKLLMTLSALRDELSGLEFVIGRERDREVHEGSGHNGLSGVVQVLAARPSSERRAS